MPLPTSVILNRVQETLLDETGVYWDEPELIDYINGAISALCLIKPDTYTITAPFSLVPDTKQELPEDGFQFFDVIRNLSPRKTAVTVIEKNLLDHADPEWHSARANRIQHYIYDDVNPTVFHVYPAPSLTGQTIEIVYARTPDRVTGSTDTFPLKNIYETPIYYMTLSIAYNKNAKRGDTVKSTKYNEMFMASIGMRSQSQYQLGPKVPDKPA